MYLLKALNKRNTFLFIITQLQAHIETFRLSKNARLIKKTMDPCEVLHDRYYIIKIFNNMINVHN